jgi:hypothetical protein
VKKWKAASMQPCNPMPLIGFGDAMFGGPKHCIKLRGKQPGIVNVLWRVLRLREKLGQPITIKVDEYLTSQVTTNAFAAKEECIHLKRLLFLIRFATTARLEREKK